METFARMLAALILGLGLSFTPDWSGPDGPSTTPGSQGQSENPGGSSENPGGGSSEDLP